MGRWKYINWLITLIVLVHMYRYFFIRYQASASVYIVSTIGWLLVGIAGYYIFVVRVRKADEFKTQTIAEAQPPKNVVRERPKVAFKKKDADSK